ncbi:MAG: DOPA 4,5-dioxygenase family protein [Burkholderiales bacterium]
MIQRPQNLHAHYHAHVYFDETSTEQARELCQNAASLFGVAMGRVHQKLVGPHPHWSCQLAFDSTQFDALVPWLDANRNGLNILVHAQTGNNIEDHTTYASWLGEPATLDLSHFEASTHL